MAAPILFPDDPNLQTKTVLADNDIFLIGSPANGNLVRRTTLASIKDSIDIPMATTEADGLMSSEDKTKLLGLSSYTHPATHSLDMITETETLKVMTAEERDKLAAITSGGGSGDVYLGTYTTPQDMLASDAEVGQYCYLELDSQKYPVFCIDEDPTVTTSWFAVGGGAVSVASEPPIITSIPLNVARHNVMYHYQLVATNSPINFSVTGLPTGLTCNPYTGLVSGFTTADIGTYTCTAYASNLAGTGSVSFSITVSNTHLVESFSIDHAFALKKLSVDATYAIQVRNGAGDLMDIGFDSLGALNTNLLLEHCGAGNGYVVRWYNQGLGKTSFPYMEMTNTNKQPMIVISGSVSNKNGHPTIFDHRYGDSNQGCGMIFNGFIACLSWISNYAFEDPSTYAVILTSGYQTYGFLAGDVLNCTARNGSLNAVTFFYDDNKEVSLVDLEYPKDTDMHTIGFITTAPGSSITCNGMGVSPNTSLGLKGHINCMIGLVNVSSEFIYNQIYNEISRFY